MRQLGVIRKRFKSSKSTATSTSTAPAPSSSNAESLGPLVICRTNPKDGPQVYICKRLNCKQTITIYQNLVRHDRIHRKAKPWRCGVCGHKSSQNSAVKNHIRRKHFNPIWRKKKSKNLEKRFDDYLLKNLQKDSEFLQKEKELFANAERITLPSYKCLLTRYEQLTLQYRFECRIDPNCQWRFTKNEHRLVHEREHIGILPYQCTWPVRNYTGNANTDICGQHFLRRQFTRDHIREKHNSKHGCYYIGQRVSHLQAHDRVHSGQQPFSCRIGSCTKQATTKSGILHHIEVHHPTEASVCLSAGYGRLLPLAEHVDIDQVMLDREQLQIEQWLDSEECRVKARNVVNTQHFRIRSSANTRSSLSSSLDTTVQTSATTSETASAAAAAAGTFSCRHCGRIDFENFESLRRHDRLDHSHFTPFYCAVSDCNFAGQLKEDVERHFSEFHSSEGLTFMSQYLYVDEPALDLEEEQIRQWLNTVDVQIANSASTENGQRPSAALQTSTIENDVGDNNNENSNSNAASTNTAYSPPISSCAESLGPLVICRTNPKDGPPIYICQRPNCKQKLSKYQHLVRHDRIHRKANPWRCGHQQQSADDLVEEKYEDDVDELFSPPSESSSASSASASSAASKEPDSVIICCETRNNRPYFICQRGMPPCGKEYTYITSLKRHDRGHRGVTPFSCRECTYSSTPDEDNEEEEEELSGNEENYDGNINTEICGQHFLREQFTRDHIREKHNIVLDGDANDDDDPYIDQYILADQELLSA
ncbi:hypothetical protein TYRP_006697 [Tyrophagus putrescentiae]|nr:hypothetical protein TYRP_006697 [Tyrophagus putrescentiae]